MVEVFSTTIAENYEMSIERTELNIRRRSPTCDEKAERLQSESSFDFIFSLVFFFDELTWDYSKLLFF